MVIHQLKWRYLWEKQGAEYIHIVDLDGAKTGDSANRFSNSSKLRKLFQFLFKLVVAFGQWTLSMSHIASGVSRIIIGTAAITNRPFLEEAVAKYGDKIAVSIDARNGLVATDGWTETSDTMSD